MSKKDPTVWMRSIRWHTYDSGSGRVPQPPGSIYLAHEEQVENIEKVLKFAVRDTPPKRAVRTREMEPGQLQTSDPVPIASVPPAEPAAIEPLPTPSATSARARRKPRV